MVATFEDPIATRDRGSEVTHLCRRAANSEGLLGDAISHHLENRGKQARSRLALAACDALGVDPATARSWGSVCELLHNASLVHDDLIDRDERRRGRPTVWRRYGAAVSVLAGDYLLNAAYVALASLPTTPKRMARLLQTASDATARVIRGAALERENADDACFDVDLYRRVITGKTGPFLSLPLEGALILAGREGDILEICREAMNDFGAAYQVLDDLKDLIGGKEGRPAGSDLEARIMSAPVVYYAQRADEDGRRELVEYYRAGGDAGALRQAILDSGAVGDCEEMASALMERARVSARRLPPALAAAIERGLARLVPRSGEAR